METDINRTNKEEDKIRDFKESEIRKQILTKVKPNIISKGNHWKGKIEVDNQNIGKVKIPNDHNRVMHSSLSQHIARDLKITNSQFNKLIDCSLTGPGYYDIIRNNPLLFNK